MKVRTRFFISLFFVCFALSLSSEDLPNFPFTTGEKLEYDISWGFIPVGTATLAINLITEAPKKYWQINFSVSTNDFADAFYKVRTRVRSEVDYSFSKSLYYSKNQQEGKTVKSIEVKFDYDQQLCFYSENSRENKPLSIDGNVFDPLSIVYAFRLHPHKTGERKVISTCDGKKSLAISIKVGEKDQVRVPLGKFTTHSATPEMKNLSGVFKKSPKGILRVWYSVEDNRIPVLIKSKVVVGSFTAKLRDL